MKRKTFLDHVAEDLLQRFGGDLSHVAVVFPNKRAALFLNRKLAHIWGKPLWSPAYLTVSELFQSHSTLKLADHIELVCRLYHSYLQVSQGNQSSETLDRFYGWGEMLLADFDDIDKNLAPAKNVFCDLKDYHALDDDPTLSEQQKQALMAFFSNFKADHATLLKRRFKEFWSRLGDIYTCYKAQLQRDGVAYEGMIYRNVAEGDTKDFEQDVYAFVGFNMMQQAEKELCRKIGKVRQTLFYWDYDRYYMNDDMQEAGHYIKENIAEFGNALADDRQEVYDNFNSRPKHVTFMSAQTEDVQSRYISEWLVTHQRYQQGTDTAVVMCDEKILTNAVHCLPDEVDKVNVTTGFPLQESPVNAFVAQLIAMQTEGNPGHGDVYRAVYVRPVLSHPYSAYLSESCPQLLAQLRREKIFYPTRQQLALDDGLAVLFRDIDVDSKETWKQLETTLSDVRATDVENLLLLQWIKDVLQQIGMSLRNLMSDAEQDQRPDPLMQESLFRMYTLINRFISLVSQGWLRISTENLRRLLQQVVMTTTIPFHGEPAEGVQLMGVLETRNLDFNHMLILSCNDGNMPKSEGDSSFIPYSVRKAYGLTTIDNKVAIYAYYFYRMLQRATDITICYNSSTVNAQSGEMSRFMRQMLVESGVNISMENLLTQQNAIPLRRLPIVKSDFIRKKLDAITELSPTAINNYIRCQLIFYYKYVIGIKQPDDDDDEIDNVIFGLIFHKACEIIYRPFEKCKVTSSDIQAILKSATIIPRAVDEAFKTEFFKIEANKPFKMRLNGLQLINRRVVENYVRRLLRLDERLAPFTIVALEKKVQQTFQVSTANGNRSISIGGIIDRLDAVGNGPAGDLRMRVVDYKTGSKPTSVPKGMDSLFTQPDARKCHGDYYLQTFLYAMIISRSKINKSKLPVSPALIYIRNASSADYDPILVLGEKVTDIESLRNDYEERLRHTVADMLGDAESFEPTKDSSTCATCIYSRICGLHFEKADDDNNE